MKPIRIPALPLLVAALQVAVAPLVADQNSDGINTLTPGEKADGWTLLFDGKSLEGWRVYGRPDKPARGWVVEDGLLHKQKGVPGGNLITEKKFTDFEFSWEWRIEAGGNNGVKYFVTEERPGAPGHEYQMLDDAGHPDGRVGPDRQTAAFYEVLPPAADKPLKAPGEWNTSKIVVQGNHVEHWLNGSKVLVYTLGSDEVKAGIADSKFRNAKGFGEKIAGHIMLTDHQDACWFRNLKLREH